MTNSLAMLTGLLAAGQPDSGQGAQSGVVPPSTAPAPVTSVGDAIWGAWNSVQSLPWSAHALAIGGLVLGLAMWLRGKDLIRPLFALLGAFKGAVAGFAAPAFFGLETIGGFSAPIVGLIVGGLMGFGAGVSLYKFAMAISGALVATVAGVLIAGASLGLSLTAAPTVNPTAPPFGQLSGLTGLIDQGVQSKPEPPEAEAQDGPGSGSTPTTSERLIQAAKPIAGKVRVFVEAWSKTLGESWRALTTQQQGTIIVGGLGGLVTGFLVGSLMPSKSASIITALLGSAIVLSTGTWLVRAFDAPGQGLLQQTPGAWLVIWLVTAGIGLLVQVGPSWRGSKSEKSSEKDD
jgi:hypothetical protein